MNEVGTSGGVSRWGGESPMKHAVGKRHRLLAGPAGFSCDGE